MDVEQGQPVGGSGKAAVEFAKKGKGMKRNAARGGERQERRERRRRRRARERTNTQLAYLDFGLVSEVPVTVRDGLVCAVVLLVGKEYEKVRVRIRVRVQNLLPLLSLCSCFSAPTSNLSPNLLPNISCLQVAELFGELMLLPQSVLDDPVERAAFTAALAGAAGRLLSFEAKDGAAQITDIAEIGGFPEAVADLLGLRRRRRRRASAGVVPTLRFDRLLGELTSLAPRFAFQVPTAGLPLNMNHG